MKILKFNIKIFRRKFRDKGKRMILKSKLKAKMDPIIS